jgi:hypothetical protein
MNITVSVVLRNQKFDIVGYKLTTLSLKHQQRFPLIPNKMQHLVSLSPDKQFVGLVD